MCSLVIFSRILNFTKRSKRWRASGWDYGGGAGEVQCFGSGVQEEGLGAGEDDVAEGEGGGV